MPSFTVIEQVTFYDPEDRRTWAEEGQWPHSEKYGFHEAVVAAHFMLRGYYVLNDYSLKITPRLRTAALHFTHLFHDVVGTDVSRHLTEVVNSQTRRGDGLPDLFVFREEHPNDPKIRYSDPLLWFWVEVKGPGEQVRDTQKRFWRLIAQRSDLGLGPQRIRLYRALPHGFVHDTRTVEY